MDNNNENRLLKWFSSKQVLLISALLILTIALIFFFRDRNFVELLQKPKSTLLNLYTANLKPLFVRSPITNEDVFNFALYKELPLDKDNKQYIQLGNNKGEQFFEFRKYSAAQNENSYEKFISKMNLNEKQRQEMDNLLDSYKDKIEDKILVNDNNTFALNSNLWNLNKALLSDVYLFTSKLNSKEVTDYMPAISWQEKEALPKSISKAMSAPDSNYIFVTPDSIFVMPFVFNEAEFRKEKERMKEDIAEMKKGLKIKIDFAKKEIENKKNFKIKIDKNYCRIEIPDFPEIPKIEIPELDNLNEEIQAALADIKISKAEIKNKAKEFNFNYNHTPVIPDVPKHGNFELNIQIPDVGTIVKNSLSMVADSLKNMDWKEFEAKMDSLDEIIHMLNDSFDKKDLQKELRKLEREKRKIKVEKSEEE